MSTSRAWPALPTPVKARYCPFCHRFWRPQSAGYVSDGDVVKIAEAISHCPLCQRPEHCYEWSDEQWEIAFADITNLMAEGLTWTRACRELGLPRTSARKVWLRLRGPTPSRGRRTQAELEPLIAEARRLLAQGLSLNQACIRVGISHALLWRRKKEGVS